MTAGVLSGLFLLLVGAGVATAAPAAAADDPTRPDARVTHGPSCRPGGLVVEVKAGTSPYFVRLATTRQPGGEDEATVAAGATVVLRTDDVEWGETIDGRLEFTARDGSGDTFVDELDNYSFTRPTQEDCDAANDPTQPHPSPPPAGPAAQPPAPEEDGGTSSVATRTPTRSSQPQETEAGTVLPGAPGETVTVHATGFQPGERVVVQFADGAVLGSVTAGADGSVRADVRIPQHTETGRTTVSLVGADSDVVAGVDLRVAAVTAPSGDDGAAALVPLVAAATALVASAAGLVSVAGRQGRVSSRRRPLRGSA